MHPRQHIREVVVSAITGLWTTGNNVTANRLDAHTELPSLNVTTLNEDIRDDMGCMSSDDEIRELRLVVEGRVKATDGPEDDLDVIVDEVEEAILNSEAVNDLALDMTLASTAFSINRDGAVPIGKVEMVFAFLYQN